MPARVFAFESFELDERSGELTANGTRVAVAPKVFELLSYLVRNANRLLSRDELLGALWPDAHVTDASLARAVTGARAALRGGGAEKSIETVPRRGYRFVAAVAERTAAPAKPSRFALLTPTGAARLREGAMLLGRSGGVDVAIDDGTVSRVHARLTLDGHDAAIEDLGSKNGTFVNGARIGERLRVAHGDRITLGSVDLVLVESDDESTTTMHAASGSGH